MRKQKQNTRIEARITIQLASLRMNGQCYMLKAKCRFLKTVLNWRGDDVTPFNIGGGERQVISFLRLYATPNNAT